MNPGFSTTASSNPVGPTAAHGTRRGAAWPWLLVALAVGALAWAARAPAPGRGADGGAGGRAGGAPHAPPLPVVAAAARRGDVPIYLRGLGTVTPLNTVAIHTRVDGELVSVDFVEGRTVREGDLLAQVDPRPFQAQLAQAQGQLAKDEAILENARRDLGRYRSAGEGATQQQRDTAEATVAQYVGVVATDRGQVDAANLQLTYCRITSPHTGRIGLRQVDRGNIVHASDPTPLAVVTQLEPIAVIFTLPEDDLRQVQKATAAATSTASTTNATAGALLPALALDRDATTRLAVGSLLAVDNQIDQGTGTVRLKAVFANGDHALFPNQFVNVSLLVETRKGALLVPSAAVQRGPPGTFVYVVKPDSTVELRPVAVGPAEGGVTVVERGLAPGEVVVTEGTDRLQPGAAVVAHLADGTVPR